MYIYIDIGVRELARCEPHRRRREAAPRLAVSRVGGWGLKFGTGGSPVPEPTYEYEYIYISPLHADRGTKPLGCVNWRAANPCDDAARRMDPGEG